jgi:hypothetical protein
MGKIELSVRAHCVMAILGLALLAPGSSVAATTPIYKCVDAHLGLLYTDEPCKDGEAMNIRAGDADPAAVARLDRERDALDKSAAQRIAAQRRLQDREAQYVIADGQFAYGETPYEYGAPWWPAIARTHAPRVRAHKALEPRRLASMPSSHGAALRH